MSGRELAITVTLAPTNASRVRRGLVPDPPKPMKYQVELKKRAIKDLKSIPKPDRARIISRMDALADDLSGDVKRLTDHTPEYRMRSGEWRVLFEVDGPRVIVHRVRHRREAYAP